MHVIKPTHGLKDIKKMILHLYYEVKILGKMGNAKSM